MTDLSFDVARDLMATGVAKEQFYCPFWRDRNIEEIDKLWNFGASYRVTGYLFMFRRDKLSTLVIKAPKTWKVRVSDAAGISAEDAELMADVAELMADVTFSYPNSRFYDIGRYRDNATGIYISVTTPHLRDLSPEGGNIVFMDGHVDWRPFADMRVRTAVLGAEHWY